MNTELENFLQRNGAFSDDIDRLEAHGVETLVDARDKAAPADHDWSAWLERSSRTRPL